MPGLTNPALQTIPLAKTYAAEVSGLDFSQPLSEDDFAYLRDAVYKYGVVVLRKTTLDDESALALGRRFGELDSVKAHRVAGRAMRIPNDEIFDVGNLDQNNQVVTDKSPERVATANGNALWHADGAFNPRRTGLSILRGVELPPPGTGGHTEYLDTRAAWDDLPEDKKVQVQGLVGCNTIFHNRKTANPDSPLFRNIDPMTQPTAKHKIAQLHEPSGRMALYVQSYTHHIDGMSLEEGQALLKYIFDHCKQDKYKFVHHWKDNNDVAIWDNTAVLHRATHGDYEGKYRRDMRRVSVFDTSSTAYGENDPSTYWQQGLP
ncbi:taurine catabolism dioxygenase [Pyrenochaeta sp. DS3sAY3a]|nr:taurine catabolism dioxygenase [Pyrenochaeta sp. DS3sAY3a]